MADPAHIRDLTEDPTNRRLHNPRNIGMIADSLQAVGAARSIVIDEDGVILAGNGVTEAAGQVGITKVRTIDAEGDEIIAVRRKGLTDDQKRKLALFDNRSSDLSDWDTDQLAADLANGLDLTEFFTPKEITELIDAAAPVIPVKVARPTEVMWILIALPIALWPKYQPMIEELQESAEMSTMVSRSAADDDPFNPPTP